MRFGKLVGYLLLCAAAALGAAPTARAVQPWDWKFFPQADGTDATFGVFFPGVTTGIEHRRSVYGSANQLRLAGSSIVTVPFGSAQADVDMRILYFMPGFSVGVNESWRNYTFTPEEPLTRAERRERYASGQYNNAFWPYVEGRMTALLQFNDYVLLQSIGSVTHEDRPDRSYDWQNSIVHDRGLLYKWDSTLFLHHKKFGALGPKFELIDFKLDGDRHTQVNYGFMLVTRTGLTRFNDIFALQMLFHTGGLFGSYDNSKVYGSDIWRLPFTFLIAYVSDIPIWTKTEED